MRNRFWCVGISFALAGLLAAEGTLLSVTSTGATSKVLRDYGSNWEKAEFTTTWAYADSIQRLFVTSEYIFCATSNGLRFVNRNTKQCGVINAGEQYPHLWVNDIAVGNKKIWLATKLGVCEFNMNTGKLALWNVTETHSRNEGNPWDAFLSGKNVESNYIAERNGLIWYLCNNVFDEQMLGRLDSDKKSAVLAHLPFSPGTGAALLADLNQAWLFNPVSVSSVELQKSEMRTYDFAQQCGILPESMVGAFNSSKYITFRTRGSMNHVPIDEGSGEHVPSQARLVMIRFDKASKVFKEIHFNEKYPTFSENTLKITNSNKNDASSYENVMFDIDGTKYIPAVNDIAVVGNAQWVASETGLFQVGSGKIHCSFIEPKNTNAHLFLSAPDIGLFSKFNFEQNQCIWLNGSGEARTFDYDKGAWKGNLGGLTFLHNSFATQVDKILRAKGSIWYFVKNIEPGAGKTTFSWRLFEYNAKGLMPIKMPAPLVGVGKLDLLNQYQELVNLPYGNEKGIGSRGGCVLWDRAFWVWMQTGQSTWSGDQVLQRYNLEKNSWEEIRSGTLGCPRNIGVYDMAVAGNTLYAASEAGLDTMVSGRWLPITQAPIYKLWPGSGGLGFYERGQLGLLDPKDNSVRYLGGTESFVRNNGTLYFDLLPTKEHIWLLCDGILYRYVEESRQWQRVKSLPLSGIFEVDDGESSYLAGNCEGQPVWLHYKQGTMEATFPMTGVAVKSGEAIIQADGVVSIPTNKAFDGSRH
jgi:hypothetical protein